VNKSTRNGYCITCWRKKHQCLAVMIHILMLLVTFMYPLYRVTISPSILISLVCRDFQRTKRDMMHPLGPMVDDYLNTDFSIIALFSCGFQSSDLVIVSCVVMVHGLQTGVRGLDGMVEHGTYLHPMLSLLIINWLWVVEKPTLLGRLNSLSLPYFHVLFNLVIMLLHDLWIDIKGHDGLDKHVSHFIPNGVAFDIPLATCGGEPNVAYPLLGAQN